MFDSKFYNEIMAIIRKMIQHSNVLLSISAVYTQSGIVFDTDDLDSLKSDLVVTAYYDDESSEVLEASEYTLSGTLEAGTSTITVSYSGKTTTFTVTVTELIELYSDSTLYKNLTTGTITEVTGGVDIASTGTASWNLYAFPETNLPRFGDLNGHTIRFEWSIDATPNGSTNEFVIAFDASDSRTSTSRLKYCALAKTVSSDPDGSGTYDFVVSSSIWTGGTGTVTDTSYLRFRVYLNGKSGASAQYRYKFYDLGVLS